MIDRRGSGTRILIIWYRHCHVSWHDMQLPRLSLLVQDVSYVVIDVVGKHDLDIPML